MSNDTLRSHTRLRAFALFASSALVALACSSNDTPSEGGAGSKGMSSAGTSSVAGTGGKGGGGMTGGNSGGSGGASAGTTASGTGGSSAGSAAGGSAGSGASAGKPGMAGTGGTSAAGAANGGTPAGGAGGMAAGMGGATSGSAGAATAGTGGGAQGGMGGSAGSGTDSTKNYTCNLVLGIDSTSEWFTGGFENQVPNDKWELIYFHPGYVEDWADPNDMVWSTAITSPCAMNSTNPERVIFNMFADTADTAFTNKTAWVNGIAKVVANLKAKYSRLKRIDLLTMTRAPNNMACDTSNQSGSSVAQYTDDAVAASVAAGPPAVVSSGPFFAPDCSVFTSGGPHFTDAGKPIIAKLYGDHYSAEP